MAYGNVRAKFKYKQFRSGDNVKANNHLFALYAQHKLNDNLALQGTFSINRGKVKTQKHRFSRLANAKFSNSGYYIKTSVLYNIDVGNDVIFIPHVDIKYKEGAYTETGAGVFNLTKEARSASSLSAVLGGKITMNPQRISDNIQIVPELHASLERYLETKSDRVKAKLGWQNGYLVNQVKSGKLPKMVYNVGGGLMTKHKSLELAVGYDCILRQKYQSHQGSLKVKLLF